MNVTINTDASFSKKHKRGSFAIWIVSHLGTVRKSGMLRTTTAEPWHAEMKAIVNALALLDKQKWIGIRKIFINTDCLNAIHCFTNDAENIQRWGLNRKSSKKIRAQYAEVAKHFSYAVIDFRHVKAHTATKDQRTWVNSWCDQMAKEHISEFRRKMKEEGK